MGERMTEICVNSEFLLGLLTEVSRSRALAHHETDVLEAIVCRGHKSAGIRIRWTTTLDRKLMQASNSKGGIKRFALANGISEMAAYRRVHVLRKGKAVKLVKVG